MTDTKIETSAVEAREQKTMDFLKSKLHWIYYLILSVVIYVGAIVVRSANISKLKDVTTGTWTLAPDLDPYLFLRLAKYIVTNGSLMAVDTMRYVPVGFKTAAEMPVVSYIIAYLYKFLTFLGFNVTVDYVAIISPVIFFALAMIAYFVFIKQVFPKYKHAELVGIIAVAILSFIPGFLHRTMAGICEKEAHAFVFMFLALYFLLKAWRTEGKWSYVFAVIGGVMTAITSMIWGGGSFIFVATGLTAFIAYFVCDFKKKDKMAYVIFMLTYSLLLFPKIGMGLVSSITCTISNLTVLLFIIDLSLGSWLARKFGNMNPKFMAMLVAALVGIIGVLIIKPAAIMGILAAINTQLFGGSFQGDRLTITIAENMKTYFSAWGSQFGNIFWVFFMGSALLLYDGLVGVEKKSRWRITSVYIVMIVGVVFTRMAPNSILNGNSLVSNLLFIASIVFFIWVIIKEYLRLQDKSRGFEIDIGIVLILSAFFFALFSARGAIRMLYLLYPIVPVIAAYATVRICEMAWECRKGDEIQRIVRWITAAIVIFIVAQSIYSSYLACLNMATYGEVPSAYNVQWQQAMGWVRENTPKDAVFSHWWDYGYWVQSLGERATVLDGGNAMQTWDYLMGRYVLTASSEQTMLEFMKTHNSEYLLIDSTDIGKYTAFSSIGSDENCSQVSWIPMFYFDEKNTIEKRNETVLILTGGSNLDEDMRYKGNIFIKENSGIGAFYVPFSATADSEMRPELIGQPKAIVVSAGRQTEVPVKCVYYGGQKKTFEGDGIDGCLFIVPRVDANKILPIGGAMWLGPRLMKSEFSKLYLFNEVENFQLVHSENNIVLQQLNDQYNLGLPEFTMYGGELFGPIKIWKANFPANITTNPKYLSTEWTDEQLTKHICN